MNYRVPNACYICCSNENLSSRELVEEQSEMRPSGGAYSSTTFSLLICDHCQIADSEAERFRSATKLLYTLFLLLMFAGILLLLGSVIFPTFGEALTARFSPGQIIRLFALGFVGLLPLYLVARLVGDIRTKLWLNKNMPNLPISGAHWVKYARMPKGMSSGYPKFGNPQFQELYDRANPSTADREVRDQASASAQKFLLGIGAVALLVILGMFVFAAIEGPPKKAELGPAAKGRTVPKKKPRMKYRRQQQVKRRRRSR